MSSHNATHHDIFLSYSHKDEDHAKALALDLQARGVRTFLDQKNIDPGALFEEDIFSNLNSSKSYGVLLTRNSLASSWVIREFEHARKLHAQRKIRILPLLFEPVSLPDIIGVHNVIDFRAADRRAGNLGRLMFPGITGRNLLVWLVNLDGKRNWDILRERLSQHHGVLEFTEDDVLREWFQLGSSQMKEWFYHRQRSRSDYREGTVSATRVVVVINMFGYGISEWGISTSLRFVAELRELTRNSADEVVFILFHKPDEMTRNIDTLRTAARTLPNWRTRRPFDVARLQRYFQIDIDLCEQRLSAAIDLTWPKVLHELMNAEHRD